MKRNIACVLVSVLFVSIAVICLMLSCVAQRKDAFCGNASSRRINVKRPIRENVSAEPIGLLMTNSLLSDSMPMSDENMTSLTQHVSRKAYDNDAAQMASDKNQVMDELLNLPQIPSDYAETMIALFRDSTQDVVTRDFAVQHIGLYAQALNRRGQYDPKSAEAERCRAALFDAASETETIVAAAAFRALSDVSEFDSCISARRLNNALVRCASDESASLASRVMAVQLCGERQVKESKESLRSIVSSSSTSKPLRLAAKHSIERL